MPASSSLDDVRRKLREADQELRDLNAEAEAVLIALARKDIGGTLDDPAEDAAKN
jgi:hypothetical protein